MMGVKDVRLRAGRNGIIPVETEYGVTAMSVGFIIEEAEVVTWFHDMRRAATEEFCANVAYGELDYLIIDLPAGAVLCPQFGQSKPLMFSINADHRNAPSGPSSTISRPA